MTVLDVRWTPKVNILLIQCDCGNRFLHLSNYSAAKCDMCDRMELWHGIDPKPETGIWSIPQMRIELLTWV
jgi:hypothetical protein